MSPHTPLLPFLTLATRSASAALLPRYLAAMSWYDGPISFLSTVWQARQPLDLASASPAFASAAWTPAPNAADAAAVQRIMAIFIVSTPLDGVGMNRRNCSPARGSGCPRQSAFEFRRIGDGRQAANAAAHPGVDARACGERLGERRRQVAGIAGQGDHQRVRTVGMRKRLLPLGHRALLAAQHDNLRRRQVLVERGGEAHEAAGLPLHGGVEKLQRALGCFEVARLADEMAEPLQRSRRHS